MREWYILLDDGISTASKFEFWWHFELLSKFIPSFGILCDELLFILCWIIPGNAQISYMKKRTLFSNIMTALPKTL